MSNLHICMLQHAVRLALKIFLLPDGALGHTWHRQRDIQGDLALSSEDTHHTEGLHLTAGSVDWGAPQICQLAEDNAVLIWDGTARAAIWGWFIRCKWTRRAERHRLDYFMMPMTSLWSALMPSSELTCLLKCRGRRTISCIYQLNSCDK